MILLGSGADMIAVTWSTQFVCLLACWVVEGGRTMFAIAVTVVLSFCVVSEVPRRVVRGKSVECWWGEAAKRLIHWSRLRLPHGGRMCLSSLETFLPQFIVSSCVEQTRALLPRLHLPWNPKRHDSIATPLDDNGQQTACVAQPQAWK